MKQFFRFLVIPLDLENRVFGLDLIRAIAILLVVFAHGDRIIRSALPHYPIIAFIDGVDLFFVLSGFLIGQILIRKFLQNDFNSSALFQFWKRRWFRTLPNYYLVLTLSLLYASCTTFGIGDFSADYYVFLQNFSKPHPDFFPIAWSLAVEEWFYILLPISLFVLHKAFPVYAKKKIILLVIAVFMLLPMMYRFWSGLVYVAQPFSISTYDVLFRKLVVTRLDTLMFGVLGAYLKIFIPQLWCAFPKVFLALGVGFVFCAQWLSPNAIGFYVFMLPLQAFGILLMLPFCDALKNARNWLSIPVTYISIISYSMYLIHYTLILAPIMFLKHHVQILGPVMRYCGEVIPVIVLYGLYFVLTVVLSAVLYKVFEKPITDMRE
jgi:peptidoglycan/LPS O-acetylase OafA/YrhL